MIHQSHDMATNGLPTLELELEFELEFGLGLGLGMGHPDLLQKVLQKHFMLKSWWGRGGGIT